MNNICYWEQYDKALADLGGGVRDARPPLGVQILSISCSFRENLACSRPPWRVHAPPSGKSWIRHCKGLFHLSPFTCEVSFVMSSGLRGNWIREEWN